MTCYIEFWTAVLVMQSEHAGWPYYIAKLSNTGSVPRCLCTWKCSYRIIHECNTSSFHYIQQYAPDIVTIRIPLNGDQLCGQVYAHLPWPNYGHHWCRQQIKVSWDYGYLSRRKCSRRSTVFAQSSCFNFKTISVTDFNSPGIINFHFPWPNYGYCYSLRQLKGLAHADLAKKHFLYELLLCYVRLLCSINFCFGPVEMRQFKINCSGLEIDWGFLPPPPPPPPSSYLRNAYYVITFCCFSQFFCRQTIDSGVVSST